MKAAIRSGDKIIYVLSKSGGTAMISKLASLLLHNSARQNCRNARNINSDQAYCYGNAHDIATMDFVTHLSPAFAMAALVEVVGSIPAIPDA